MIKHEPILELQELKLTKEAKNFLKEIAKWAKFLAILGFIGIALIVILAISYSTILKLMGQNEFQIAFGFPWIVSFIYMLIAVLFFFPNYYLFQFAKKMKLALVEKNDEVLTHALEMLKSHYKFYGVFTISIISIYAIVFAFFFFGLLI